MRVAGKERESKFHERCFSVSEFFFFSTSSRLFLGLPYFPYDEEAKKLARMIIFLRRLLARSLAARFACHHWKTRSQATPWP